MKKEIILGTQLFGSKIDQKESLLVLDKAFNLGIRRLDAAERYPFPENNKTYGLTELIISNWLKASKVNRTKIQIDSKITGRNFGEIKSIKSKRLYKKNIIDSVHKILKRLNVDYLDTIYLHWPDRFTNNFARVFYNPDKDPKYIKIEDQYEAFLKLRKDGKILKFGLSNETPWGIMKFCELSRRDNFLPSIQEEYSVLYRNVERSIKEIVCREKLNFYAYSPLSGGLLTGKYFSKANKYNFRFYQYRKKSKKLFSKSRFILAKKLSNFCRKYGKKQTHLAISFLKKQSFVKGIVIGVSSKEQLIDLNKYCDKELSEKFIDKSIKEIWNENTLYK